VKLGGAKNAKGFEEKGGVRALKSWGRGGVRRTLTTSISNGQEKRIEGLKARTGRSRMTPAVRLLGGEEYRHGEVVIAVNADKYVC